MSKGKGNTGKQQFQWFNYYGNERKRSGIHATIRWPTKLEGGGQTIEKLGKKKGSQKQGGKRGEGASFFLG